MDILSLPATYEVDLDFDSDKFIKMRAKIMHDEKNYNNSVFKESVIEDARPSLKNTAVLGNVVWIEDDYPDFGGHDRHIETDRIDDSKKRIVYDERPIGVVPESCNYEFKKENGLNYVFCDLYIFKEYANYARDIIERDEKIKLSMEIYIDEYKKNNKTKTIDIKKYRYKGITLLGSEKSQGMKDAHAQVYSLDTDYEKFTCLVQELTEKISCVSNESEEDTKYSLLNENRNGGDVLNKNKELGNTEPEVNPELNLGVEPENKDFSLNTLEKVREIEKKLEVVKYEHPFCGQVSRYWLIEIQGEEVICSDRKENGTIYGIVFVESGDEITINFDERKRKKTIYTDFLTEEAIPAKKEDMFETEVVAVAFEAIKTDLEKANFEVEKLEKEATELNEQFDLLTKELESLKEFKENKLLEQKKDDIKNILSKFEDLSTNEDFIALQNKALEFEDLDLLEEKCFAIRGRNVSVDFSKVDKKGSVKIPVNHNENANDEKNNAPYGGLLKKANR